MTMRREIRRVALGWEPPKMKCRYIHGPASDPCPGWHWHPHFDESHEHAVATWEAGKRRWDSGEDPDSLASHRRGWSWEEWTGERPDPSYYRPEWPEGTPLGYCFYETTSEGTPLSPIFATTDGTDLVLRLNSGGNVIEAESALANAGYDVDITTGCTVRVKGPRS